MEATKFIDEVIDIDSMETQGSALNRKYQNNTPTGSSEAISKDGLEDLHDTKTSVQPRILPKTFFVTGPRIEHKDDSNLKVEHRRIEQIVRESTSDEVSSLQVEVEADLQGKSSRESG